MESKVKTYPISEVKKWNCTGTPELLESVSQLGVLEPIILGKKEGTFKILAGQRRVASLLKAHANLDETGSPIPEHLKSIRAVVYEDLSDTDANAITIAENEQRSANPIATWKAIQAAKQRGDFDAVIALAKINKARLKAIQRLNEVRPGLIAAYDEGKISEGTLVASSSLGGARQDYLLTLLQTKKRITMGDVAEAKTARAAAVLASMPVLPTVGGIKPVEMKTWFIVLTEAELQEKGISDLQKALEAKLNGGKLFRLVEIS